MRYRVMARCRSSARPLSYRGRGWQAFTAALVVAAVGALSIPALASALPPGYAYEKVTPVEKGNGEIGGTGLPGGIVGSADGNSVLYTADSVFAGAPAFPQFNPYYAFRTPTEWSNSSVWAKLPFYPSKEGLFASPPNPLESATISGFSSNGEYAFFGTNRDPVTGAEVPGRLYKVNLRTGALQRIGGPPLTGSQYVAVSGFQYDYALGSTDYSYLYFPSESDLTTSSTEVPVSPGPNENEKLYLTVNGGVSLASWTPEGKPARGTLASGVSPYGAKNAVSADGHVYFYVPVATGLNNKELYRGEAGVHSSVFVNESENTEEEVTKGDAEFEGASTDGGKVAFVSRQRLVDGIEHENLPNLYLYTNGPDPKHEDNLTLVSESRNPAEPEVGVAVTNAWGISEDGNTVYFSTSRAQLVPGGPTGENEKVYRWHDGELSFIAEAKMTPLVNMKNSGVVSPNGRYFMFNTATEGITPYDTGGFVQAYLYDSATGSIACISCVVNGKSTTSVIGQRESGMNAITNGQARWLSNDGRAFFQTSERLIAQDTNEVEDVYTWKDGLLSLVSGGRGSVGSEFVDASVNGDAAFFLSHEQLVRSDTDQKTDLYEARLGGGMPEPESQAPAACEGEPCRGHAQGPPAGHTAGTSQVNGAGSLSTGEPCAPSLHRFKVAQRKAKHLAVRSRKLLQRSKGANGRKASRLRHRGLRLHRTARKQRRHSRALHRKLRVCRRAAR